MIDALNNTVSKATLIALVFAASLLGGCVTTTETVFTEKASPEKALERRVELARQYIGERNWADAKRNLKLAYDIDPDNAASNLGCEVYNGC